MNTREVSPHITISIVSHGQFELVKKLLDDLQRYCANSIEVVLTLNIAETVAVDISSYIFPLRLIRNDKPRGFSANHNAAFDLMNTPFYCVLNPDIRLLDNPFPLLCDQLQTKKVGVVAPQVLDERGQIQDNARRFPTVFALLKRFLSKHPLEYLNQQQPFQPDWVGGMFMMFSREVFQAMQGFDESYYLYCEDMDLCARLRQQQYRVALVPQARVVHQARRDSHCKPKYLYWHCQSMLRYFYRWHSTKFT